MDVPVQTQTQSAAPSPEPLAIGRHKLACTCRICTRARERIALGLPKTNTRPAERLERAARRIERTKRRTAKLEEAKQHVPERIKRTIERTAKLEASLETQVRLGHKPDLALAAATADISAPAARKINDCRDF